MTTKRNCTFTLSIVSCFLLFYLQSALANSDTPVGLWKTIDDDTGKPASLIRISEKNGKYIGTIEKLLDPSQQSSVCDKCLGTRKNQLIIGMTIMQGLQQKGGSYEGGEILDPDNGKTYQCKVKLTPDGKILEVRGFIGTSLFGRSQTWLREE